MLLEWLHPHDISFWQRLELFGVLIVISRLSSFAVSSGRMPAICQFRKPQTGGCGQKCPRPSIHSSLSWTVPRTLLWCVAVVDYSQVNIRFRFIRSFNNYLRCAI